MGKEEEKKPISGPQPSGVSGSQQPAQGAATATTQGFTQTPMQPLPQVQQLQLQIAQLQQQLQIAQAIAVKERNKGEEILSFSNKLQSDFDNFRRRTAETNKRLKEDGIFEVIEKLIGVLDVFKRAITMITDTNIADGVKMIYRQFNDILTGFGVKEIPALGEMFDPELHNAVMTVPVKEREKVGIIVEVLQKGYIMGTRVVRHSAVKVAK